MIYNRLACWWHTWFGWCPLQWCMICGKLFWAGLPRVWLVHEWRWIGDNIWRSGDPLFDWQEPVVWRWRLRVTWLPRWCDYCSRECADADLGEKIT